MWQAKRTASDSHACWSSIQVFDMFGIEQLDVPNKLEQLCINYANERLQQLFMTTTLTTSTELPCLRAMQGELFATTV
jgi:myosin heavy subunit